jgi:ribonuclease P protein subunit POP4
MPITPENLPKHELIGLEVEVIESTDESLVGIKGEVLDETQSILTIENKQVEKKNCIFQFILPNRQEVKLNGELINKRPEERAGMTLPNKWGYKN